MLVGLPTAGPLSPGSAPWRTSVAVAVWSGAARSAALVVLGLARRAAGLLVVAAALSALLTFSTFGVLVWPVSLAQLVLALGTAAARSASGHDG
jgi:hypothetical protein